MMQKALMSAILLATVGTAVAQTGCPPPVVKVLRNGQEVPSTGGALVPKATLIVSPSPQCPGMVRYLFKGAELTLIRGRRPILATMQVRQPEVDLTALMSVAQPGDRIHVFIPYQNLVLVSADGKQSPYVHPESKVKEPTGIGSALITDEAKGVSFNWLLKQK